MYILVQAITPSSALSLLVPLPIAAEKLGHVYKGVVFFPGTLCWLDDS